MVSSYAIGKHVLKYIILNVPNSGNKNCLHPSVFFLNSRKCGKLEWEKVLKMIENLQNVKPLNIKVMWDLTVYTVLFLLIFITWGLYSLCCVFYAWLLLHKKIFKFILECTFYLFFGECYIFLTKYDLYVYSLMMAKCIRLY